MSCPEGSRLALDLAEAKNASVLTDTHLSEGEVPLRVREEERARAARRLVEIRMAYVEHKAMCPICLAHD
jgi:hypothetical protein